MRTVLTLALALFVLMLAPCATAHDLYLVTGLRGSENRICARIGERFPESTNAVSADRVEQFRIHFTAGAAELAGQMEEKNRQFCAPRPSQETAIVAMVVRPRFIKLAAKDFNAYIAGEGLNQVIRLREQRKQTEAEGKELYSRYAKLLIGALGERATHPLALELEIVPMKDPASLRPGEALPVRVLFRGVPLAHVQVAAVYAGAELKGHEYPVTARTDAKGNAKLQLDRAGLWYARLIYMIPAEAASDADWRSFFATLTFDVPRE